MLNGRIVRALVVGVVMLSILVSLGPPGVSKEGERSHRCPRFKPVEPDSLSEQKNEAPEAKVLTVRERATKDDPLVLELAFDLALWVQDPQ